MGNRKPARAIVWTALILTLTAGCATRPGDSDDPLLAGFLDPPARARPDAFWTWLNGHADPARITAEMEAFKAAGFARLQVWDVLALQDPDGIVPTGPPFLSDPWLANLAHANREALRLDLELGLLAASGWNAGGPWVEPEQAGIGLFSSESIVRGPAELELALEFPEVPEHAPRGEDGRPAYWGTVAVQAVPVADGDRLVPEHVVDLSDRLGDDGLLGWEAPEGEWTVRWFVFANTGQRLIVPSPGSDGLQIDFFDANDSRRYFTYVLDRLESAVGPLEDSALRYLEVDSLELEGRRLDAWTEDILDTFLERYGYDARPWLSLIDGASTADEVGERVLHDWTRLVSDLMIENHYRLGNEILRERGLLLAAEAGGPGPPIWNSCPVDAMGSLGAVGLMRGEFWPKQRSMYNVKQIASAAHTYGHTLVDAESFTSWRHWHDGPYYLKQLADQAFLDGLNHITFHTAPHGGAERGLPGFAYHAGTHMGPNLVWWPMAGPFIEYLSRTSFLLQEGLPVADVAFYQGDGAPAFHPLAVDWDPTVRPAGYDYDLLDVRVLTGATSVRNGRIVLPHGVSYAVLVLPDGESIDLAALRRIRDLVRDGATVVGPRPTRASGLGGLPEADEEVREIADELWGPGGGELGSEHRSGAGRVIRGGPGLRVPEVLAEFGIVPDFSWEAGDARTRLSFVHRATEDAEIYFVVNENERWEQFDGLFRVSGRAPELWDPADGSVLRPRTVRVESGRTRVPVRLPPGGSTFVVFRDRAGAPEPGENEAAPLAEPLPRSASAAVDVALGEPRNGPAWVSAGERAPAAEFIVYDLGSDVDLGSADVWNYQHRTRGLLTRGIREVEISTSSDGATFEALGRVELRKSPEIGERDYEQRIPVPASGARYVRLDVVSNWSDDWSGWTDIVALNRIAFVDVDGNTVPGVRVHEVSSGVAHDPATDELHPAPRPARDGIELGGPWRLRFQEGRGAPAEAEWPALISWRESEDPGIRFFSGIAEYALAFAPPADLLEPGTAVELDLGRVAGTARVFLNGEDLGVVWKPPYAVDVTDRLRPGDHALRIEVANTWHNRLVGDATLPPGGRITTTNIRRPFTPDTPLLESGLLGPVRLVPSVDAP
jgi:hypothetical protein